MKDWPLLEQAVEAKIESRRSLLSGGGRRYRGQAVTGNQKSIRTDLR